jgi:hypothetical protein
VLRTRVPRLMLVLTVLLGLLVPLVHAGAALAASATGAAFSGGAGTASVGGMLYAKQGAALTLTVTTDNTTKCVRVTDGTTTVDKDSGSVQTSWTFTQADSAALFTAGSGNDVKSVTATAFKSSNSQHKCTGNQGETFGPQTASYILDNLGPTVTGAVAPAANAAGWNNQNVTITWSASDAGSGVATNPTPATDSVTTDTAGVTKSSSATDRLGNGGSGSVIVKLDKTTPAISGSRSPAANAAGWNNTDITVNFTCSDTLSEIKSCVADGTSPAVASRTLSASGADQSVSGTANDIAGNVSNVTVGGINIDKVAPALAGAPTTAPAGTDPQGVRWYNGNVAIAWTCSDALSGIPSGGCPANGTVTGEGTGLKASASVSDKAGNTTNADSAPVNIDRTAPSTDATAPSGWTNKDQTVTLSATDALSGVKTTSYILDGGVQQTGTSIAISGNGTHTLEFWSEDYAGNAEGHKKVDVKIDGTSPEIGHTQSPAANTNGWNNSNVTVHFVCSDALSGIATCTPDQVVSTEGKDQIVTGTATDSAGNSATDPASVSIDKTPPTIAAAADRAANPAGWYDDDVTVGFTCTDPAPAAGIEPSGIDSCPAPKVLGEGANQSASGTAADAAGNTASDGVSGISVDKTAPSLSGAPTTSPNANDWYSSDVTIAWTCSDALSGIPTGTCPANDTVTGEGSGLASSASVSDTAGNTTAATSTPVNIDRSTPVTSASVPAPLDSGWYAGAVQVTLTGVDSLSGVDTTYYSVDGGAAQLYTAPFSHSLKGAHTIRFWSVDKAGNVEDKTSNANSITLKIDGVPPTITGSRDPAANANGWNNIPVAVSFACGDAESGIALCVGDQTLDTETTAAGTTVVGNATDNAGNTSEATVGPIKIDMTKPDLAGQLPDPQGIDPAGATWYRGDVAVAWPCSDGLSGIDGTCPAASTVTGEGRNRGAGPVSVADKAGNTNSASVSGVNIDRVGPVISGAATTAPNAAGWYSGAVKVDFTCADPTLADGTAGSDVASCPSVKELTDEGANQSVTSDPAKDYAGNTTAGKTVGGIRIDNSAPNSSDSVQCTLVNGFCNGSSAVSMTITASDPVPTGVVGVSGVKEIRYSKDGGTTWTSAAGGSVTVPLTLSASGTATVNYYAVDNAGNAEGQHADSVNYDGTAPKVTHTLTPTANAADWSNADTLVHFTATDDPGGSGVDATTVTADKTYTTETAGQTITGSASDKAGNTGSESFTFKLDKTNPTITASRSPAAGNANGWNNTPVTVSFTCADPAAASGGAGSGVAVCPDPVTLSTNNKAGSPQSVTRSVSDLADNTASATVGNINIDMEAPTVSISGVVDDGKYVLGAVPTASCTGSDDYSGLAGAVSTSKTGGLPNGVGSFTYSCSATDKAGNTTTKSVTYKVIYNVPANTAFFLQPINDTAHTTSTQLSIFKAGQTIPVKFQLRNAAGTVVQANSAPRWLTPLDAGLTTAPIDDATPSAAADTGTTYRWSSTDQLYIYNWGTSSAQALHKWSIGVQLDDGQTYTTYIGLRR